ncbi:hypothetical protein [Paraburkholderia sp. J67]|uniref:hypothetical protein n=1 Tax=Paraburkholderia sp. J67 TaxID=2805435 RepID=UPI002ABE2791|nr:hypothetical protein [Paraburkholderia sp. J67]
MNGHTVAAHVTIIENDLIGNPRVAGRLDRASARIDALLREAGIVADDPRADGTTPTANGSHAADEALQQCHARALAGLDWSLQGEAETKALSALLSRHEAQLTRHEAIYHETARLAARDAAAADWNVPPDPAPYCGSAAAQAHQKSVVTENQAVRGSACVR